MPRRISSASRTPRVVIRPDFAPVEVSVALVVTVVPWTMVSIAAANSASARPCAAAISARPSTTAIDGSAGVESVLWISGSAPSRVTMKSVKVPPTSMPTLNAMGLAFRSCPAGSGNSGERARAPGPIDCRVARALQRLARSRELIAHRASGALAVARSQRRADALHTGERDRSHPRVRERDATQVLDVARIALDRAHELAIAHHPEPDRAEARVAGHERIGVARPVGGRALPHRRPERRVGLRVARHRGRLADGRGLEE